MKSSPYITWAKKHHNVKFNLASSSVSVFKMDEIVQPSYKYLESGMHEDGWTPLMNKISERYRVDTNQVSLVHGASMANHLVYALMLTPGDHVLIEHPCYEPLKSLAQYFGADISFFSRDAANNYQPQIDEIEEVLQENTKLIVLTNLHNPSGILIDRNVLKEIITLAEKHDCYILIDEVYIEFLYPHGEQTSAALSTNVITTRSLTKAYGMDDLRVGWIIASADVTARLKRLRDLFSVNTAFPSERLALDVLNQADALLASGLELLKENFKHVSSFIDEEELLEWNVPTHGTVGFVKLKRGSVDSLVKDLCSQFDTVVAPGEYFGSSNYFRIGWGMETNKLKKGLNNLSTCLENNYYKR